MEEIGEVGDVRRGRLRQRETSQRRHSAAGNAQTVDILRMQERARRVRLGL